MAPPDDYTARMARDCIACGRCLDVCPLFKATQREDLSPKATHQLNQLLQEGSTEISKERAEDLAGMCLACGRCADICPQGLSTPEVVSSIRAGHSGWRSWIWLHWIKRAGLLWPTLTSLANVAPDNLPIRKLRLLLPSLRSMKPQRLEPWLAVDQWDQWGRGKEVALFAGCTGLHLQKHWPATARTLLEGCGFTVIEPKEFVCCGATLGHAGLGEARRTMQQRNVDAWRTRGRPLIATYCASCRHGLKGYRESDMVGWELGEARQFVDAIHPLTPFLRRTSFTVQENAPPEVVWHLPCHGGTANPDGAFLRRALGERLVRKVVDRCCGMGGVMQLGNSDLPGRVAAHLWDSLMPEGADPRTQILTGCSGCTVQLNATKPPAHDGVSTGHWLDCIT